MICEEDHYLKYFPHREAIAKYLKGTSQLVQKQHLVVQNNAPSQGGNTTHSHHGDACTSTSEVYMFKMVNVTTQENTYDTPPGDHTPFHSNVITFNMYFLQESLSHQRAFQIQILGGGKNIHRTI
jgi:hypothetical protein